MKQDKERTRAYLSRRHEQLDERPILSTVSGVLSTKTALVRYVDRKLPAFGIVTTKSYQVNPNPGYREPVLCEVAPGSFGNAVGLRNCGMEQAIEELKGLRKETILRALLNVSISASSPADFITLVGGFEEIADIIELNFSCPHANEGYGAAIGCSPLIAAAYMSAIRKAFPTCKALIFAKLTPNVPDIAPIARAVVEAGADGIVAINTVGPELYIEPQSGAPILYHKWGGKSGLWIFDTAVTCVAAIRKAVGPDVPIIGMGGVATGTQIAAMIRAGADAVGIGSAFGKVHQKNWRAFSDALANDSMAVLSGKKDPASASLYYSHELTMRYERRRIVKREQYGSAVVVLTLEGSWSSEAGQFVFLWIPQVGEKPFSIAHSDPLTFVIKRRGPFTEALFQLAEGDTLYLRGLYGAPMENEVTKRALLVAGGTGVAVLPSLARHLVGQGTDVRIFIGTSDPETNGVLADVLTNYGPVVTVSDDGIAARVLNSLDDELDDRKDISCYVVGPKAFMAAAVEKILTKGITSDRIYLSLELDTLCGVGMCGECACQDRLTCQWGTFVSYAYLAREVPQLI